MYLNRKIIILVESRKIPVLYMTFTSPGYCLGISMRCMELLQLYKHIFHVLAIQLFGVWQVWIDFFFLHYSMHSIFTVYHDGWKLDKYVPWITENGSSKSKYNMWCVLYAGYSADFSRLLWISFALDNVCWLIL